MDLMTNDPNHTANQYAVSRRLVPILIAAKVEPEDVEELDNRDWFAAVQIAKTKDAAWRPRWNYVPSESTKRLIAAMIRAETAPTPTTDPFAGLPGVDD